jgi:hypothetical protein
MHRSSVLDARSNGIDPALLNIASGFKLGLMPAGNRSDGHITFFCNPDEPLIFSVTCLQCPYSTPCHSFTIYFWAKALSVNGISLAGIDGDNNICFAIDESKVTLMRLDAVSPHPTRTASAASCNARVAEPLLLLFVVVYWFDNSSWCFVAHSFSVLT